MTVLRGERVLIRPRTAQHRGNPRLEKAGFEPVDVMRQYERLPGGEWHDSLLMDLLAHEL